jgi:hypothetical protein
MQGELGARRRRAPDDDSIEQTFDLFLHLRHLTFMTALAQLSEALIPCILEHGERQINQAGSWRIWEMILSRPPQ